MNRFACLLMTITWLGLGIALAGCESGVNTTSRRQPKAHPNTVKAKEVIIDKKLGEMVRTVNVRQTTVSGDMLKVQADVQNTTRGSLPIAYRFEWYGPQGIRIPSTTSGWQRRTLLGGETFSFLSVAPTPKAADFRLKITKAKR